MEAFHPSIVLTGIHKRHVRNHHMKKIRPQIHHRAHQQPTRAAARNRQPVRRRVLFRDEPLGARDKIRERILLVQQLAVFIPLPSQIARAANVCARSR